MLSAAVHPPRPMAGKPLVIMMIQRISTGARGKTERSLTSLKARPTRRVMAWVMFSARRCSTNFLMLSNMRRPSSTALRILRRRMSAANASNGETRYSRGKVVVGENDITGVLGDVASSETHSDSDIGTLESGTIVDSISSCKKGGISRCEIQQSGKQGTHSSRRKRRDGGGRRPCGPWWWESSER